MLPRRRGPDLNELATFTLDAGGLVASWSASATRLFGLKASEVIGHHVCDVLLTVPGQRRLVRQAMAEVAAGRTWTASARAVQSGHVTIRCEPLVGLEDGVLVVAQPASPKAPIDLLSQATARIGSTLDLVRTAREVADVTVPRFADGASVLVAERLLAADDFASPRSEHGMVVRRLAARLAGRSAAATDSLLRSGEVLVLGRNSPGFRAMTASRPVLFDCLDDDSAERVGRRPDLEDIAASYSSFLVVPLVARRVAVGCAMFGRTADSPPFGLDDVALASEIASRAAICIDNARLYHRERRTALALQRGLLPGEPRVPAELEVAQRYLPVGGSVVGGDWHDIVPLPGGRAVLIVGDAMGHGPEAATVMVQLRTAAHILAELELPPCQVLSRLDQMAAGMTAAPFATCIYMVIDPAGHSGTVTQAGHLPPVLVLSGGATKVLRLPTGLPLGLGADSFDVTKISVPPGATLAVFTDGLVESRTRPLDDGLAALRDALSSALARPGGTLDDVCETVIRTMREQGEDDITLVLARIRQ